jgi:hypothetical protein
MKNLQLASKWNGATVILDINDRNAMYKIKNKTKVINMSKLKLYNQSDNLLKSDDDTKWLQF